MPAVSRSMTKKECLNWPVRELTEGETHIDEGEYFSFAYLNSDKVSKLAMRMRDWQRGSWPAERNDKPVEKARGLKRKIQDRGRE